MDWVYGDFRTTRGKKVWALESKHDFDWRTQGLANRHIARAVVEVFDGIVTFEKFTEWVNANVPRVLPDGTTNPELQYYLFDGRTKDSIMYEPLYMGSIVFYQMIRRMDNPYKDFFDGTLADILAENEQLKNDLLKLGTVHSRSFDRQRMLLDHSVREIESVLKLLKEI